MEGGREQAREGACCHCHSVSSALAASLGKVLGWIAAGTPLPAGPPAPHHPRPSPLASRLVPALPRPAGRARRGADYISSGLAGRVFPEPRLPEPRAQCYERRPSPRRPFAGR